MAPLTTIRCTTCETVLARTVDDGHASHTHPMGGEVTCWRCRAGRVANLSAT